MEIGEKVRRGILTAFYCIFSLVLLFVITISILHPLNNLYSWQMAVGTVLLAGIFLLVIQLIKRFKAAPAWIYYALLGAFGFALLLVCLDHGNIYHFAGDYEIVYMSALDLAEGREVAFANYFMTYGNNTAPMIFLAGIIKFSRILHVNEFYPLLICSIGTVLGATWAVGYLLNVSGGKKLRLPSLIVIAACLPVYVFTNAFYTDTMSFGVGLIAMALLVKAYKAKKLWFIPTLFAALLTIWGANWKITCIIPLIALLVVCFIRGAGQIASIQWKRILLYIISLIVFEIILIIIFNRFAIYKQAREYSNPTTAWIAMGMMGDGSYEQNVAFSDAVNELATKQEKKEFVSGVLRENIGNAFSWNHIVSKMRNNFASGTFTASDFTYPDEHGSTMYELMDPGGKYYWRSSQYCFIYIFAIYLVMLVTGILAIIGLIKDRKKKALSIVPWQKLLSDISFLGIFIFLLIWESNNRQLYNSLPVFVLGLFGFFAGKMNRIEKKPSKE